MRTYHTYQTMSGKVRVEDAELRTAMWAYADEQGVCDDAAMSILLNNPGLYAQYTRTDKLS